MDTVQNLFSFSLSIQISPQPFFKIPKIFINTCMYAQRPLCSSFRMPDVNFKMTMGQLLIFLIRQLTTELRIVLWFVYFCCIYRSKLRFYWFFIYKNERHNFTVILLILFTICYFLIVGINVNKHTTGTMFR